MASKLTSDAQRARLKVELADPAFDGLDAAATLAAITAANRAVARTAVTGLEILRAIDPGEYGSLNAGDKAFLQGVVGRDDIDLTDAKTRNILLQIFAGVNFPTTRNNLAALQTRTVSALTEWGLPEPTLHQIDVARA